MSKNKFPAFYLLREQNRKNSERMISTTLYILPMIDIIPPSDTQTRVENKQPQTGELKMSQTIRVMGIECKVGTKKHAKLIEQKRIFDQNAKGETGNGRNN